MAFGSLAPMQQGGGVGNQGLALLKAVMDMQRGGGTPATGAPATGGPAAGTPPGLLSQFLDPQNFGGKEGLFAKLRGMMPQPAVPATPPGPMDLAPPAVGLGSASSPTGLW